MLTSPLSSLVPAVLDRLLLWLNHVLAAEPAAAARLVAHAGRRVAVQWQGPAGPWPLPPEVMLVVTPAGLCERVEATAANAADLRVRVSLPAPHEWALMWLAGGRPAVAVEGDAQFAADMAWLAEHLHWDVEHDLARFVGDGPAHQLARLGASLRDGLRVAAQGLTDAWSRRPGARPTASR